MFLAAFGTSGVLTVCYLVFVGYAVTYLRGVTVKKIMDGRCDDARSLRIFTTSLHIEQGVTKVVGKCSMWSRVRSPLAIVNNL